MTLHLAISRCNGVSSPVNALSSVQELQSQLIRSKAKALFTCEPLLDTALQAAKTASIPKEKIYICDLYGQLGEPKEYQKSHKTLSRLVAEGSSLPDLEPQRWQKGQAMSQIAFLVYSSGTTGTPVSGETGSCPSTTARSTDFLGIAERNHDLALQCHRQCPSMAES